MLLMMCAHAASLFSRSEYLYPVGSVLFEDSERVIVLYQQNAHLELWLWDPLTQQAVKGLSHYAPAGLTIVPSRTQFSFIDHERIRIKSLSKKSPKALDMYPLYDFGLVYWIDDENCYCSAREHHNFGIFHITAEGNLYRIARATNCDYTYPQKVGSSLFYIKRTDQGECSIERTMYPTSEISSCEAHFQNNEITAAEKIDFADQDMPRSCVSDKKADVLFTCNQSDQVLTFLTMKSETEGYFLKHIDHPFIERYEKVMVFECWHFTQETVGRKWVAKKLFTFSIPLTLLYGEQRLYEAILRLLPNYQGNFIFYVSASQEGYLNVYRYNTLEASSTCLAQGALERYFFTPYFYNQQGFCGGMVKTEENSLAEGPTMQDGDAGEQIFTFPMLQDGTMS